MKQAFNRTLTLAAKLSAAMAACLGCSPNHGQDPPSRQIHWKGPETGFTSTTAIEPDNAGKAKEGQ